MEFRGRLLDIVRDYLTGLFRITIEVGTVPSGIDALRDRDLRVSLTRWREKRTLTANAYYWVLVGKIAEHIEASTDEVHNILLRRYGKLEIFDGEPVTMMIPDTDEAEEKALRAVEYHIKPTSKTTTGKDGKQYRVYRLLRGSSDYDSKEFSALVDGAVAEAKHMGIETLPEEQIQQMKDALKENE